MDDVAPLIAAAARETMPDSDDLMAVLGSDLDRIRRTARLLLGDADDADDAVADAIAATLPHWRSGQIDRPVAYVRRAVVNRATGRWRRVRLGTHHDHRAIDWLPVATDATHDHAERDRTLAAVRSLPARRRAIVVLRYYEDLTLDEIATTLRISVGTVKSQLSRAHDRLRIDLEEPDVE